ncbi:uncharacterized protein LOC116303795 [Actinia tenebrosa]|uniref:Uncharacterized protein LOC116303795 n=1 Tax=Actinia tenebrosa TaxID=6105 RepID=A0A6P8ISQ8_ACTTE|nr:uncharacterized protein LOC116303795 [Actinia tenebrosa]
MAIWNKVVPIEDLSPLIDLIKDNGGETNLSLSLRIPGLTWNSKYGSQTSTEYKELKQKLINNVTFVDGMYGKQYHTNTQLVSIQRIAGMPSGHNVVANLKISFTQLKHTTAIELQEILENLIIGGQNTEIVECSSDDNFFCSIPTNVNVRPGKKSTEIVVGWKTFTDGFNDNGYYRHHRFVYNISSTANGTTTWADTLSTGISIVGGLKPFTHYCIRMAIESFKASGFFSEPKCTRTNQDKPSIPPIILSAYNTSHVSIFVEWNQTIPRAGWNGIPIGYQVDWVVGNRNFGINDSYYNITTGLRPYTWYTIKVSGRTIVGAGASNAVQVRTSEWCK